MNISLTPIRACTGAEHICGAKCYAVKAYKQYPATRKAWDDNLILAQDFPELYFQAISDSLAKYKGTHFRWHVAGDILNLDYLFGMNRIAQQFPHIQFLAFTKQYGTVGNFPMDLKAPNLQLVISAWPEHDFCNLYNLPVAYVKDKLGRENRIPEDAHECPGSCDKCKLCWELKQGQSVVFNQH